MRSSEHDAIRSLREERARLHRAHLDGLSGLESIRSLAAAMDAAVTAVWASIATADRGVAVVALGGYGRGELSPYSDVDLMVLHAKVRDAGEWAGRLFYALWDAGLEVGHAIRTPKDCARLSAEDLEAEMSFLDARFLAGDRALCEEFASDAMARTRKRGGRFLGDLVRAVSERHAIDGHTSYLLEPNLKEGAGGLRDLHAIGWLRRVFDGEPAAAVPEGESERLASAAELFHRVRNHLHWTTERRTDVLLMQHQDAIARFLGYTDERDLPADPFMRDLYRGARAVEHALASLSAEMTAAGARRRASRTDLGGGIRLDAGRVGLDDLPPLAERPDAPLALYAASGRHRAPVSAAAAARLRARLDEQVGPVAWTPPARRAFFDLLGAGDVAAMEGFDEVGALVAYLPEWEPVSRRPQHNVYHRYTVDVHAYETVAGLVALREAHSLAGDVSRDVADVDAMLLAGLLHDAGKGLPGDHSITGEAVARSICQRIGLEEPRAETVAWLVRNHLLLSETATRRDTGDENLVVETAAQVGDLERLRMLFALSVADGMATGPAAWNPWKEALVGELFSKLAHVLERGELTSRDAVEVVRLRQAELRAALASHPERRVEDHLRGLSRAYFLAFPTSDLIRHFALMEQRVAAGEVRLHAEPTGEPGVYEVIVVAADRPGLFGTISGALALNGVAILAAQIFTRADGAALEVFRVSGRFDPEVGDERWKRVREDAVAALAGTLSLGDRLAEKRSAYAARPSKGKREATRVVVDNRASDFYTVVEVHATDRIGLLFSVTTTLAALELDIHVAKVATYAEDIVDAFYVRDLFGQKVTDSPRIAGIQRALLEALETP